MNHLAHAVLAGDEPDLILGSLLGDFVHGPVPAGLRRGVELGIRLHRAVDVYTDSHAVVAGLRGVFVAPFRRYAGILLDVWFDHLLARDFARWCATPLDRFSDDVLALLLRHADELPPTMRGFVASMRRNGLPAAYADAEAVGRALAGIGTRLSRANPLHEALPVLQAADATLQQGFEEFFPQLREFARDWLRQAQG
ncbi:ACP phosphodiesterase [Tahibacter caeni]|uniref:acyl carrier protein phosphodiesterase n=1 Tax=Tahibacter caeni TaxID=1453545 RepID=UPI0021485ED2|nr:ACP phosphodiesterase [Tahibacter caeni]